MPPALVLWLVLSWTVLPLPLGLSSAVALLVLALPLLLQVFGTLFHTVKDRSLGGVRDLARNGWITAAQAVHEWRRAALPGLPERGCHLAHAGSAVRDPAASAGVGDGGIGRSPPRYGLEFLLEIHVAGDGCCRSPSPHWCCWCGRKPWLPQAGFFVAWLLSPVLAWWVSQDRHVHRKPLSAAERRDLGIIARKTWGFFESFVGAEDHWLPPDNFQEEPRHQVAHRTSPTNQGLLLVSTLAAHDFGYLNLSSLLERLEKTFETLERLERFRGPFLQLVRHAHAGAVAAELCFNRR